MKALLQRYLQSGKVLLLGFGREGQSTYRYLRHHFPKLPLAIADRNENSDTTAIAGDSNIALHLGENYLDAIKVYDVIIKSPGVQLSSHKHMLHGKVLLSQAGLFLECYGRQIIGITGTKGKSTTSSLISHILNKAGRDAVLVGNIGKPAFDFIDKINAQTLIVFELSAHQLEYVHHAPHIAILLNFFEEHLDYFGGMDAYVSAKMNIVRYQNQQDHLIFDKENERIFQQLHMLSHAARLHPIDPTAERDERSGTLVGNHNKKNIAAARQACQLAGLSEAEINLGISTFQSLEHRLEWVGNFCGRDFYNDSISTIPESTIEAVKTIDKTYMLILGGFDRGINYGVLAEFLAKSNVQLLVFTGAAGRRMAQLFVPHCRSDQEMVVVEKFDEIARYFDKIPTGRACLLSPAAASYDEFTNFEERGKTYKKMAEYLGASCH
ncbi:MAG TPA: UDP-N-acetylmuramoyl-L-alanine--D-glutamate ligase [Bacteroidales bacterium]|nr:UDP-N-acetylmuramoyl-L-alanine--D-glutamate ligase [Bacteroidales bacterium]